MGLTSHVITHPQNNIQGSLKFSEKQSRHMEAEEAPDIHMSWNQGPI